METYLLGQIDGTDYKVKTDTPLEKINFVFECFINEYECKYNTKRLPNIQDRLADYLRGLPTCISLPYTHFDILQLAKELQEAEEFSEQRQDRICSSFFNFIAYHLIKLKDKNKPKKANRFNDSFISNMLRDFER